MEDPNKNDRILSEVSPADLKVKKNLEDDLKKAKDIAELGAQAINSAYIASLFDSEMSLAGLLTENPLLSDIYKNVQKLVYYSLKLKEDNLKLNNRVTNLLESSDNNNSKTIVQELQASKSTLEKENAELTEKIKIMKKSNEEWQQKMETLNIKVQTAKEKKKNLNVKDVETATEKLEEDVEVQTLKTTVNNLLNVKNILEEEALAAVTKAETSNKKNEELQLCVENLSSDKAKLEQQCLKLLNENKEHKKDCNFLQSRCYDSDKKIVKLFQSEKTLKEEKEAFEKRNDELKKDKKYLEGEKGQLHANENRLKKYIAKMEEDLKNQKDENTILKNSANTFEQNIVLLENNVKELKLIVERQESLSESMTLLNDILEKKVATLEVQNERQAAELERLCDSLYMHKKNARIEKPEVPKTP